MTPRERYLETLTFGRPDRIPFTPGGPMDTTMDRWLTEGLPAGKGFQAALLEAVGLPPEPPSPRRSHRGLGVSFSMIPEFEEKILEHRDGHNIVQDWMGAIVEIADCYDAAELRAPRDLVTRKWHKFPVESRADFAPMKERFDPHHPERFPEDFEARCEALRGHEHVVGIHFNGPFWQLRDWCGFEGLCTLMIEDPDFVQEMCEFWAWFVSETMQPILSRVSLDSVGLSEDMAFKEHSMISPAMARRFLAPAYEQWSRAIHANGCRIINMDCDGYVADLIPIWIETGITVCWPLEVAAGNDSLAFRKRFGQDMAFIGCIDKRVLATGGDVMREEVCRVVPPLLESGGFIPRCDHAVPDDVSWPNFVEYARLIAELTGWV